MYCGNGLGMVEKRRDGSILNRFCCLKQHLKCISIITKLQGCHESFTLDYSGLCSAFYSLSVNFCQHWFEYFPNPPVNVLAMMENVLAHHDKELLQHLIKYNVTSQVIF